jgi:putative SOS response-associated peptidase YedK
MCGRYSLFTPIPDIEISLGVKAVEWAEWQARYNGAPTQTMPVITNEFPDVIQFFRWGLVPKWAKETSIGHKMINTRTESIVEKPAFKNIFKYKRCLVLADGYYEWMLEKATPETANKKKATKQPFRFHLPHNEVMLLAGLWDTWKDGLHTFSIITCPANADLEHIHNRMPVLLTHQDAKRWLSNDIPADELLKLLKPAPEGVIQFYPISTLVNKPLYNNESIIEPLAKNTTI